MDSELGRCIHALEKLPPVSSDDSATEIMLCVYEFCKAVTSNQEHEEHQLEFIQRNRYRYSAFKHEIEMTTPNFQPFEQVHTGLSSYSNVESQCEARALPDIREIIKKYSGLPPYLHFWRLNYAFQINLMGAPGPYSLQCDENTGIAVYFSVEGAFPAMFSRHNKEYSRISWRTAEGTFWQIQGAGKIYEVCQR